MAYEAGKHVEFSNDTVTVKFFKRRAALASDPGGLDEMVLEFKSDDRYEQSYKFLLNS